MYDQMGMSSGYGLYGMNNGMGMGMAQNYGNSNVGGLGTSMLNNGNTMRRRISSTSSFAQIGSKFKYFRCEQQ